MKIVLATPLYPPEIAEPAPYVKELAKRLSGRHAISIVAYARFPEKVPGVSIVAIDKRRPLPVRLLLYFLHLLRAAKGADLIYAINGASVELPLIFVSLFVKHPTIIHFGDGAAHRRAQRQWLLRHIERLAFSRAHRITTSTPVPKPEILPFRPFPEKDMVAYEESWEMHLHDLDDIFTHAYQ